VKLICVFHALFPPPPPPHFTPGDALREEERLELLYRAPWAVPVRSRGLIKESFYTHQRLWAAAKEVLLQVGDLTKAP
jgi:hypothetical protein